MELVRQRTGKYSSYFSFVETATKDASLACLSVVSAKLPSLALTLVHCHHLPSLHPVMAFLVRAVVDSAKPDDTLFPPDRKRQKILKPNKVFESTFPPK